MRRSLLFSGLLLVFLTMQVGFWWRTHDIRPVLEIVPDVPGKAAVKLLSFGDPQFLFRLLAMRMQQAGDSFGRNSPLRRYDYSKLYDWFMLLDELDNVSDLVPTLAAYYYSQTPRTNDIRYMVDYIYQHSLRHPESKWWWLVQATYLANHKLGDKALALKVATPLADIKTAPVWARQVPAFIHEQRGEVADALMIMEGIKQSADNLSEGELRFMRYFVDRRLAALEEQIKKAETKGERHE